MTGGVASGQDYLVTECGPADFTWSDYEGRVSGRPSQLAIELAAFALRVGAVMQGEEEAKRLAGMGCSALVIRRARVDASDVGNDTVAGYILLDMSQPTRTIFRRGERGGPRISDFLFDPRFEAGIRASASVLDALGKFGLELPRQMT